MEKLIKRKKKNLDVKEKVPEQKKVPTWEEIVKCGYIVWSSEDSSIKGRREEYV